MRDECNCINPVQPDITARLESVRDISDEEEFRRQLSALWALILCPETNTPQFIARSTQPCLPSCPLPVHVHNYSTQVCIMKDHDFVEESHLLMSIDGHFGKKYSRRFNQLRKIELTFKFMI